MSQVSKEDGLTIIKPGTDIVASHADELRSQLQEITGTGISKLLIDLDGVEMLDSVGIGLLIATHNTLFARSGGLTLRNASADITKLLKVMRLDKHITIEG